MCYTYERISFYVVQYVVYSKKTYLKMAFNFPNNSEHLRDLEKIKYQTKFGYDETIKFW